MKDQNLISIKDMGKLMNELKNNYAGKCRYGLSWKDSKI